MLRLIRVECSKLFHKKVCYLIAGAVLVYGCYIFYGMQNANTMFGNSRINRWESEIKTQEMFLAPYQGYDKESEQWKQLPASEKQEVEKWEQRKIQAEEVLESLKVGNWKADVEASYEEEQQRLADMEANSGLYGEDMLAQAKDQTEQYRYLLEHEIPILPNPLFPDGWHVILQLCNSLFMVIGLAIGLLGAVNLSQEREKKTVTGIFLTPHSRFAVLIAKVLALEVMGIVFCLIGIGIPSGIAAVQYGMGHAAYPEMVHQPAIQLAADIGVAPLFLCIAVVAVTGLLFCLFMAASSLLCSIFLHSWFSAFLVFLAGGLGFLLPRYLGLNGVLPVFSYGQTEFLLQGVWNFWFGLGLLISAVAVCLLLGWISLRKRDL